MAAGMVETVRPRIRRSDVECLLHLGGWMVQRCLDAYTNCLRLYANRANCVTMDGHQVCCLTNIGVRRLEARPSHFFSERVNEVRHNLAVPRPHTTFAQS